VSSKLVLRLVGLMVMVWAVHPSFAQDFSADLVRQKPEGAPTTKIWVSKDMARFEATGQTKKSYVVINITQRTSSMVLPDNKSYVLSAQGHIPASIPVFHVEDAEKACPAWEKSVNRPGTCTKVGDDTVNGRNAVKYTGTADNGDTGTAWVDRKLNFVIKWEGQKTAAELQNIQEGPQDASLFQIPKDYEKLDLVAARNAAQGQKKRTAPTPIVRSTKPSK
jgi:hypothetical protein